MALHASLHHPRAEIRVERRPLLRRRPSRGRHRPSQSHEFARARRAAEELGARRIVVLTLVSTGDVHRARGDAEPAATAFREALDLAVSIGYEAGAAAARERLERR